MTANRDIFEVTSRDVTVSPVTFSPFLDAGKPKCLRTSDLKPAGAAALSQTLSLGPRCLWHPPLSLDGEICTSEQSTKLWCDGNCCSRFPSLCFTLFLPRKHGTSCLEDLSFETHHTSVTTVRHFFIFFFSYSSFLPS